VALVATLATTGVGVAILARYDYGKHTGLQFAPKPKDWISVIHARYEIGIDGISLPLLLLSIAITLLVVIYSWNHFPEPHNPKAFLALILLLEVGMNGTFVAQDLILFFVFFEVVLLPMYFMIGVWGGENRQYAAIKFFLFTLFGSALMILGFLALFFKGGETFSIPELVAHAQQHIDHDVGLLIFGGLFMGFAIKVPMWPFHTWLPDAHTQAPTQGSVILAAVMLKLGTYGFIRIAIPILPDAAHTWAPWIGGLAVIGIIYGALGCLAQTDMKRLGGLLLQSPRMGWILGFCCMASLGLPGLAGFWGEFPAILSAYNPAAGLSEPLFRAYMVIASIGTVFAAGYLLWMFQRVAFGEPREEFANAHIHDVHTPEWIAWTPMLLGIVVLGVFPSLIFKLTDGAVQTIGHSLAMVAK
jgi:NADH-quinone oxidoreductase subunit M